ncbi:MAG: WG repeat-containing protein [Microcoleaceae cyanobacterium]
MTQSEFEIPINHQVQYIDSSEKSLDTNQAKVSENYHNEITDKTEELVRFKVNELHGYKNKEGKIIIPPIYVAAWQFPEGLALVKRDLKWGYINYKGKVVINFIYDFADSFSQGIARVMLDHKYGYINNCREEVIPICYDELGRFNG